MVGGTVVGTEGIGATRPLAACEAFGLREGWWLSSRDDGFWELQRFDEAERFATDSDAFLHCQAEGGAAAAEALRLHGSRVDAGPHVA